MYDDSLIINGNGMVDNTPVKLFWSRTLDLTYKIMDLIVDHTESNPDFSAKENAEINKIAWRTRLDNMDRENYENIFEVVSDAVKAKHIEILSRPNHVSDNKE